VRDDHVPHKILYSISFKYLIIGWKPPSRYLLDHVH
jgi:hypothetical protein